MVFCRDKKTAVRLQDHHAWRYEQKQANSRLFSARWACSKTYDAAKVPQLFWQLQITPGKSNENHLDTLALCKFLQTKDLPSLEANARD